MRIGTLLLESQFGFIPGFHVVETLVLGNSNIDVFIDTSLSQLGARTAHLYDFLAWQFG